jgi:hypothetical protein
LQPSLPCLPYNASTRLLLRTSKRSLPQATRSGNQSLQTPLIQTFIRPATHLRSASLAASAQASTRLQQIMRYQQAAICGPKFTYFKVVQPNSMPCLSKATHQFLRWPAASKTICLCSFTLWTLILALSCILTLP